MIASRPLLATFADLASPEQVAEDLARSLGALLCRGRGHRAGAGAICPECVRAGRALAPAVGEALLACRLPGWGIGARPSRRRASAQDYDAIGRALDLLEQLAGTRTAWGKRR